jgi:hypothetical protein
MSSKNSRIILVTVSLIALSTLVSSCGRVVSDVADRGIKTFDNKVDDVAKNSKKAGGAISDATRLNGDLDNSAKWDNIKPITSGAAGGGIVLTTSLFVGNKAYGEVRYDCKSGNLFLPSNAPKINYDNMKNQMKSSCGRG